MKLINKVLNGIKVRRITLISETLSAMKVGGWLLQGLLYRTSGGFMTEDKIS